MSSADTLTEIPGRGSFELIAGKSLVRMLKRIGLRTPPCGTPVETIFASESTELRRTFMTRLVRKILNHFKREPQILTFVSL